MSVHSLAAVFAGMGCLVLPTTSTGRLRRLLPYAYVTVRFGAVSQALVRARHVWPAGVAAALTIAIIGLPGGVVVAVPISCLAWSVVRLSRSRRRPKGDNASALRIALTADLLAECLRAGLPVPTAVRAVADVAPPAAAQALRATSDMMALGAEPADAWEPALQCPDTEELARAARRTARSGSALAGAATMLAERVRSTVSDKAEARAQRAGVLITGPLGLCFLPAFLCLGVIPVVVGLAGRLTVAL